MATLPSARTRVDEQASVSASGTDLALVISPVPLNADMTPRQFGTAQAIYDYHGYCPGVEFTALYTVATALPVLFVGVPIDTEGELGRVDDSANTGTSVVTVAAASGGCLEEHDGVVLCDKGGTVGTDQIVLRISLDGGTSYKSVRLGTATSYAIPYVGVTISLTLGALVAGDTLITWHGTAPRGSDADLTTVREKLAEQLKLFRTAITMDEAQTSGNATAVRGLVDSYETADERYVGVRQAVRDRQPYAEISVVTARMSGSPTLTFAEGAPDTITRSDGSWITDGVQAGDVITFAGTVSNNAAYIVSAVTATEIQTDGVTAEVIATASAVIRRALDITATGGTVVRSGGSWVADGFRAGDTLTLSGTASNDGSYTVDTATPLTLTVVGDLVADEVLEITTSSIATAGEQPAIWMASLSATFAAVLTSSRRLNLGVGRGRTADPSPWSGYRYRRSVQWAAMIREFQHDLHVATWKKGLGQVPFTLRAEDGSLVEWDDRLYGGAAVAAGFTCFRSFGSGAGTYIALDLTCASEGSLLSLASNARVADLVQTIVQLNTENAAIGETLILRDDGTGRATQASLSEIEAIVNRALQNEVLTDAKNEGPRASAVEWRADPEDNYTVVEPTMHGTAYLLFGGKVHSIDTKVLIERA